MLTISQVFFVQKKNVLQRFKINLLMHLLDKWVAMFFFKGLVYPVFPIRKKAKLTVISITKYCSPDTFIFTSPSHASSSPLTCIMKAPCGPCNAFRWLIILQSYSACDLLRLKLELRATAIQRKIAISILSVFYQSVRGPCCIAPFDKGSITSSGGSHGSLKDFCRNVTTLWQLFSLVREE